MRCTHSRKQDVASCWSGGLLATVVLDLWKVRIKMWWHPTSTHKDLITTHLTCAGALSWPREECREYDHDNDDDDGVARAVDAAYQPLPRQLWTGHSMTGHDQVSQDQDVDAPLPSPQPGARHNGKKNMRVPYRKQQDRLFQV